MPDLLFFSYNLQTAITAVAGVPQFIQQQGADLTQYLAGDAIKDYPSLANIPTPAWKNSGSVYNGQVILPKPLYSEGFVLRQSGPDRSRQIRMRTTCHSNMSRSIRPFCVLSEDNRGLRPF